MSDFENRLKKNLAARQAFARREAVTAYRLYDLDIPEWPVAVDWYAGSVHVMEYPRRRALKRGELDAQRAQVLEAVSRVLQVPSERIFTKTHEPHAWGRSQYEHQRGPSVVVTVEERGQRFECNLTDYLDTGLFLDHRDTRQLVKEEARGKRFLNLFAYTGSFSVYARAGGAKSTTTVDLSNTYCEWAERNQRLNDQPAARGHEVVRDDVLSWLEHTREQFDLVVLDPPAHSTSKKMRSNFNVQRDHPELLAQVRRVLAPGGVLYFSNNFLGFELAPQFAHAMELTPRSIPEDFRRTVHRCWRLVADDFEREVPRTTRATVPAPAPAEPGASKPGPRVSPRTGKVLQVFGKPKPPVG